MMSAPTEAFTASAREPWMPANVASMLAEDPKSNASAWARVEGTRMRSAAGGWQLHGALRAFDRAGRVRAEMEYRENVANGRSRTYHANGALERDGEYRNGRPVGEFRVWYDTGVLQTVMAWTQDGAGPISSVMYYENGQRRIETHRDERGGQVGFSTSWYPTGGEMGRHTLGFGYDLAEDGHLTSVVIRLRTGSLRIAHPGTEKERIVYFEGDTDHEIPVTLPRPEVGAQEDQDG